MTTNTAPQPPTADNDLPETAVSLKLKAKQAALAEYMEPTDAPQEPTKTSSEEDTFKKRYGDLRRHMQQKETVYKKEVDSLREQVQQLMAAANQPMPGTKAEFEAWKAKYPQIAEFVEIIADERAGQRASQLQEELVGVQQRLKDAETQRALAKLTILVPDWEAYVASPEYQNWKIRQPMSIQNILDKSDDPEDLARLITICKNEHAVITRPKQNNSSDKLAALSTSVKNTGVTPSNTSSKWKYTQKQISTMGPEEFEAQEAEIIAARNAGLIYDDVSKRNSVFDQ